MIRTLKFLLRNQLIRHKPIEQVGGFTLVELLVALILATLVITPLMGFMIDVMNTERQEQAKTTSEQEIQAALDYIARDLQQAVYIYDSAGIEAIKNELPSPNSTDRVPVLVFWKRELVSQVATVATNQRDDTFIYSLVAYYLIKDTNSNWSNAARVARWQIRDGVASAGGVTCTGYSGKYVNNNCPEAGFAIFNLDGRGTLEEKMNGWKKLTTANYTNTPIVLVDFIDQTTTGAPAKLTCPTGSSLVAPDTASFNTRSTFNMTSFYACVDRVNITAQVFLRGNTLARLQSNNLNYQDRIKTYFPTASIRVQGRGYLFTK